MPTPVTGEIALAEQLRIATRSGPDPVRCSVY